MLDRLPNELLVNILSKTKKTTTRQSRLLNYQFNGVVRRYQLHKEDVDKLYIAPTYWCTLPPQKSVTFSIKIDDIERVFENYEELLNTLPYLVKNIRNLNEIQFIVMEINDDLLDVLLGEFCLSAINNLYLVDIDINPDIMDKWISYLDKLNLDTFHSISGFKKQTAVHASKLMFSRVKKRVEYQLPLLEDTVDMSWLSDDVLENWYTPDKILIISKKCRTSLTIQGVMNCLKMADFNKKLYFGMLKDELASILNALRNANAHIYYENTGGYRVTNIGGKTSVGVFDVSRTIDQ